jgi:hypothetical protein
MPDPNKTGDASPEEEDANALAKAVKHNSLFIFSAKPYTFPAKPVRAWSEWLVQKKWFNNIILLLIMVNCIILAVQTPTAGPAVKCAYPLSHESYDDTKHNCDANKEGGLDLCEQDGKCSRNGPLTPGFDMANFADNTELFFSIIFTIEAAAKIIASGFIMHEGAYLRNGWNWLDWIVVVMSWVSRLPGVSNFSAIRTVRVLRPLRTMSRIPGMGVIVGAMLKSIRPLGIVLLVFVVVFFIFGILGVQFWYNLPKVHCSADYWEDQGAWNKDGLDFQCHSLLTHLPTGMRCGCDQLGEGGCNAAESTSRCIGIAEDHENDPSLIFYDDDANIVKLSNHPDYVQGSSASSLLNIDASKVDYNYTAMLGSCGCGEVCTASLNFYCDSMGAINFDTIGVTLIAIFQCVTLEGWTDIMYRVDESSEFSIGALYFLALILFAGLFVVNLALAVIAESYHDSTEEDEQRQLEADEEEAKRKAEENKASMEGGAKLQGSKHKPKSCMEQTKNRCVKNIKRSKSCKDKILIRKIKDLVDSENFTWFVMFFIGINTALLAMEQHDDDLCTDLEMANTKMMLKGPCMDDDTKDFLEGANVFLTLFFLFEMILKLIGLGIVEYLADTFNQFDAFIVITSMIELISALTASDDDESGGGFITVLRAGRLFRVFKLARSWDALRKVLQTVTKTLPNLLPLFIILCLFIFIYSLLGMQLYGGGFFFPGRSECQPWELDHTGCSIPRSNFDSFGEAFVAIFQMMTGEDWNVIMYDGIRATSSGSFFYFGFLVLFGNYIILNLFLAILLGGFEKDAWEQEDEEGDDAGEDQNDEAKDTGSKGGCCKCGRNQVAPEPDEDDAGLNLQGPGGIADAARDAAPGEKIPECNAFGCLSSKNCLRKACFAIATNSLFENFILFCIVVSSLALAVQNPVTHGGPNESETIAVVLTVMDTAFLIIFTVELVLKHIALGVAMHDGAYWGDPWNAMDGTIVAVGWVGLLAAGMPQLKPLRAIRTMRALRPLRALRRFPGMKLAVNCLLKSIPLMFPMALVSFLFFLIFAILGLQLFAGKFWYCYLASGGEVEVEDSYGFIHELLAESNKTNPQFSSTATQWARSVLETETDQTLAAPDIMAEFPYFMNPNSFIDGLARDAKRLYSNKTTGLYREYFAPDDGQVYDWTARDGKMISQGHFDTFCKNETSFHGTECTRAECRLVGGVWTNQMTHFDDVVDSLLCLFEMSTTEGWPAVMWAGVDSTGVGKQPVQNAAFSSIGFFVAFLIVGNFFVLNLFVGAVIDNYLDLETEAKKDMELMTPEQKEWVETQKKMVGLQLRARIPEPSNALRRAVYLVVQKSWFDMIVTLLIVINIVVLGSKHRDMQDWFEDDFLVTSNWFFTIAFIIEAVLKLTAYGPKYYFKDNWNKFDFLLVVMSCVDKFIDFGGLASFFRVFRVARIIRVARSASDLRRMFQTIIISLPALGNVGALLLLLFFIYAILGVNFFHSACGVAPFFSVQYVMGDAAQYNMSGPIDVSSVEFDPCSDVDNGFGFDGFVSVNLQLNLWLYAAAAVDSNADTKLLEPEFNVLKEKAWGYNTTWVALKQAAGATSTGIDLRNKTHLKAVFANHIESQTTVTYSNLIHTAFQEKSFLKWAKEQLDKKTDNMLEPESVVESVMAHVKKHKEGKAYYDSHKYAWIQDYSYDPEWTSAKLRCTELTMKCGEFFEPEIPLLSDGVDKWGRALPKYADCKCDNMDNNANFRNFGTAFITLVRMSTGEYWNGIMHDLSDTEGNTYAFVYFFTFLILATFIMLNLVVAVMIINYNEQQADSERAVNQDHMDHFRDVWEEFDQEGIGWIRVERLLALLENLDIPLGFHSSKPMAKVAQKKALQELAMQLPDHDGWIHYTETLFALAYRNQSEAAVDELPEENSVHLEQVEKWKHDRVQAPDGHGVSEPKPLQQTIAVLSFQAVYRSYQERRNKDSGKSVDPLKRKLRPRQDEQAGDGAEEAQGDNAAPKVSYRTGAEP